MLIDAHTHLDRYEGGALDAALAEIEAHRILTVSNSMDVLSYRRNLEIAANCDWVLPTFGVHPWNALAYADRLDELPPFIDRSPMLGEIGLDHRWVEDPACYPAQRAVLERFLAAARDQDKVVSLHTAGAESEILELLDRYGIRRAIVHWYSGPLDVFREMVARGFWFTVGIEVRRSAHIQALVRELPLSQLLTETDNPGGWEWVTGEPGMPRHVLEVVEAVAELRGVAAKTIRETVRHNFLQLVQDDSWLPKQIVRLLSGGD